MSGLGGMPERRDDAPGAVRKRERIADLEAIPTVAARPAS